MPWGTRWTTAGVPRALPGDKNTGSPPQLQRVCGAPGQAVSALQAEMVTKSGEACPTCSSLHPEQRPPAFPTREAGLDVYWVIR